MDETHLEQLWAKLFALACSFHHDHAPRSAPYPDPLVTRAALWADEALAAFERHFAPAAPTAVVPAG